MKVNRRDFLKQSTLAGASLTGIGSSTTRAAEAIDYPKGKADSCIFIWLGGGAAHIDTFDPKRKGDGKKKPGSYYDAIDTVVPGVQLTEHLPNTAGILDRCILMRTLSHDIEAQHGAATNLVHTGRKPSETVIYPSIGSIVSHQLGPKDERVPSYVVMGYPNIARDPGFLGPKHGYVYLTQIETGPNGFTLPPDVTPSRQQRREALLANWNNQYVDKNPSNSHAIAQRDITDQAFQMAGPQFLNVFNLENESADKRTAYGSEFGQRCLLARRLVQSGVRFVEVSFNLNFLNGTGWDTHNDGQLRQHLLIQDLDKAFATLVTDLEHHHMLDSTLVVIATEFGRPAEFDSGGGRGHQPQAFSGVLAGGGLKTGQAIGQTDDLAKEILDTPVTIPDLHATIHCALGIRPSRRLFAGDRPIPITDHGRPVLQCFS